MDVEKKIVVQFPHLGKVIEFVDTDENQQIASYLRFLIGTLQPTNILDELHPYVDREGNNQVVIVSAPYKFSQEFFDFCKGVKRSPVEVKKLEGKIQVAIGEKDFSSNKLTIEEKCKILALGYLLGSMDVSLERFYLEVRTNKTATTQGIVHIDSICGVLAERDPTNITVLPYESDYADIAQRKGTFNYPKLNMLERVLYLVFGGPYNLLTDIYPVVHCPPARKANTSVLFVFSEQHLDVELSSIHEAAVHSMVLT